MTWTYSGDPASTDRDAIRFLIGDTDTNDQQLTDEEIDFSLIENSDKYEAALLCVSGLAAKYSREVDSSIESVRETASQKVSQYQKLYGSLLQAARRVTGKALVAPVITGTSLASLNTLESTIDLIQPKFKADQFDNKTVSTGYEDAS